jgi:hypothetical protein
MEWLLLLGFAMGWAVGLIQGTAKEKALAQELKWEKAKARSLELDLEKVQEKQSEWAKKTVQELQSQSEYQMSESQKAQALAKGWGWVLGVERGN